MASEESGPENSFDPIGSDGRVYDPTVVSGAAFGLDLKAMEAVKNWRFQPAQRDGRAIAVAANIEVNFRLY